VQEVACGRNSSLATSWAQCDARLSWLGCVCSVRLVEEIYELFEVNFVVALYTSNFDHH